MMVTVAVNLGFMFGWLVVCFFGVYDIDRIVLGFQFLLGEIVFSQF
jgi:uncharacterized membrane protein